MIRSRSHLQKWAKKYPASYLCDEGVIPEEVDAAVDWAKDTLNDRQARVYFPHLLGAIFCRKWTRPTLEGLMPWFFVCSSSIGVVVLVAPNRWEGGLWIRIVCPGKRTSNVVVDPSLSIVSVRTSNWIELPSHRDDRGVIVHFSGFLGHPPLL